MAFMTVNRVHLRSVWTLPAFALVIWKIYRQARRAPGNLGVRIFRTEGLAVWTVTAWVDESAMRTFRDSGPHGRARPKKPLWFDEAAVADWHQENATLPTNAEAATRLAKSGRLSTVKFQLRPSSEATSPSLGEALCGLSGPFPSRTRQIGHPFEEPGEHVLVLLTEEPFGRRCPVRAFHQVVVQHRQRLQPPLTHSAVPVVLQRQTPVAALHT